MREIISKPGSPARPKIGIVIGSGGIKAMAAVALFEFLEVTGIQPDLLVGCSGGAVMCALAGAGYSPAHIRAMIAALPRQRAMFTQVDYRALLGTFFPRLGHFDMTSGLLRPEPMQQVYRSLFKDMRLEDLRPKTVLQTTDIATGEGVVLSRGPVAEAVYASGAMWPVLPAIQIAGRWLTDGVCSAPVPVMEALRRGMDVIITLDFKERISLTRPQGLLGCFDCHITNPLRALARSQMFLSIEMHHHEIVTITVEFEESIGFRELHKLPIVLEAGHQAVARSQAAILSAIQKFTEPNRLSQEKVA